MINLVGIVLNFLPENLRIGMYPIGRFDFESRGAILLTNNGELPLKLNHQKYKHIKTYSVWVNSTQTSIELPKCSLGVEIEGKKTLPAKIKLIETKNEKSLLEINISEGRNIQIQKVASKFGYNVIDLKRISIANIKIINLKEGKWRELNEEEWLPILNDFSKNIKTI